MKLQGIGLENVDWIYLACGKSQLQGFMNNFGSHKRREISRLAERPLTYAGLCFKELLCRLFRREETAQKTDNIKMNLKEY
jgi:hypothetical protein